MSQVSPLNLCFSLLVVSLALPAFAAKNPVLDYRPEVKMTVQELLSLPAENRVLVAKGRGGQFAKELETMAFSQDEEYGTRWKALTLTAQIQGPKSEKILAKALKAPEWYMRNAAILAYREVLPRQALGAARSLLSDKALVVRSAAVNVLGKKLEQNDRELLWDALTAKMNFRKKQSLYIRGQILAVLANDPLEREMPLFLKHLQEDDRRLHSSAIIALERMTSSKLGKNKDSIDQKRDLWIKWAKNKGPSINY
ncbi:MAG: HEAT repeat domain-containing protein [Bdellovibrio sp.]|jgi:hypothetical protein